MQKVFDTLTLHTRVLLRGQEEGGREDGFKDRKTTTGNFYCDFLWDTVSVGDFDVVWEYETDELKCVSRHTDAISGDGSHAGVSSDT